MKLLRSPSRRPVGSSTLALCVGLSTFATSLAASAFPCVVPLDPDPLSAGAALAGCVDLVNQGDASSIDFEGPQVYALKYPLEITRSVSIDGTGQVVTPSVYFSDDSLVVIGTQCPGPQCTGPVAVDLTGFALDAAGRTQIRGLRVRSEHDVLLDDVTITGFSGVSQGAGILAEQRSTLDTIDGRIESCVAAGEGGAIFTEAGRTWLVGTTLRSNEADRGGGLYLGGSGFFNRKLIVDGATLEDNAAIDGGGIHNLVVAAASTIRDTTFMGNRSTDDGAGYYGVGDFEGCDFIGNVSDSLGGGAFLRNPATLEACTFESNDAHRGGGLAVLATLAGDVTIEHSTFVGNAALGPSNHAWGGGVFVGPGTGGTTFIRNSTFADNVTDPTLSGSYGGAFGLQGATALLEHVTFSGNLSPQGGTLFLSPNPSADLQLRSSIVAGSPGGACVTAGATYASTTSMADDFTCGVQFGGVDPLLDPLADNGGPTETMLPNEPQVSGAATCYSPLDQRYLPRPATGCDIGAVEQ